MLKLKYHLQKLDTKFSDSATWIPYLSFKNLNIHNVDIIALNNVLDIALNFFIIAY
jgi:hypothetical protein